MRNKIRDIETLGVKSGTLEPRRQNQGQWSHGDKIRDI